MVAFTKSENLAAKGAWPGLGVFTFITKNCGCILPWQSIRPHIVLWFDKPKHLWQHMVLIPQILEPKLQHKREKSKERMFIFSLQVVPFLINLHKVFHNTLSRDMCSLLMFI